MFKSSSSCCLSRRDPVSNEGFKEGEGRISHSLMEAAELHEETLFEGLTVLLSGRFLSPTKSQEETEEESGLRGECMKTGSIFMHELSRDRNVVFSKYSTIHRL